MYLPHDPLLRVFPVKVTIFSFGSIAAIRIRVIEKPGTKRDDILALAREFHVDLARTVVIGDDLHDEIRHARALGCRVLPVPENALLDIPARLADLGLIVPH